MYDPVEPAVRLHEVSVLSRSSVSDHKRRLFAVACLSRWAPRLDDPRGASALEVASRYARGLASEGERHMAQELAFQAHAEMRVAWFGGPSQVPWSWQGELLSRAAVLVVSTGLYYAEDAADYTRRSLGSDLEVEEEMVQLHLLREILGPSPSPSINASWLVANDSAVFRLARCIDEENAFELMPILADALLDAGCDDTRILEHCQAGESHVAGCWVVDTLLGRS